jgi:hypothetical protein
MRSLLRQGIQNISATNQRITFEGQRVECTRPFREARFRMFGRSSLDGSFSPGNVIKTAFTALESLSVLQKQAQLNTELISSLGLQVTDLTKQLERTKQTRPCKIKPSEGTINTLQGGIAFSRILEGKLNLEIGVVKSYHSGSTRKSIADSANSGISREYVSSVQQISFEFDQNLSAIFAAWRMEQMQSSNNLWISRHRGHLSDIKTLFSQLVDFRLRFVMVRVEMFPESALCLISKPSRI